MIQSMYKMVLKPILGFFCQKEKLVFSLYLWEFTSYLPQHCLYLRPLPHANHLEVFIQLSVHIVLCIISLFHGHLAVFIISIIHIINIMNILLYVDKMWTESSFHNTFCFHIYYIKHWLNNQTNIINKKS